MTAPYIPMSAVYLIRNRVSGKVYVGKSVDVISRWATHKGTLRRGCHHNPHLQQSWDYYGPEAFEFEILMEAAGDDLPSLEGRYCEAFHAFDRRHGYNVVGVDPFGNQTKPPEVRAKLRASQLGRKLGPMPEERRQKISTAHKGKVQGPPPPEVRQRQRLASKGRVVVRQMTLDGVEVHVWDSAREVAASLGVSPKALRKRCRGSTKPLAGFLWKAVPHSGSETGADPGRVDERDCR